MVVALLAAQLHASPARGCRVDAPTRLIGDGQATGVIEVRTEGRAGAAPARVTAMANRGTLTRIEGGEQVTRFEYRAPAVSADGHAAVKVRCGGEVQDVSIALVLPPPARRTGGGPLSITAPAHLVLGRDSEGRVTFAADAGAPPRVMASVGEISGVVAVDDDGAQATYRPPVSMYPQLAVLAFLSREEELLDWIAVPLHGRAEIEALTRPAELARARVGGFVFGPEAADRNGRLRVDVTVPPGVDAVTIAAAAEGDERRVPLDAPPASRVAAFCLQQRREVLVLTASWDGTPADLGAPVLRVEGGVGEAPRRIMAGAYVASVSALEGDGFRDSASVRAALAAEESFAAECTLTLAREPAIAQPEPDPPRPAVSPVDVGVKEWPPWRVGAHAGAGATYARTLTSAAAVEVARGIAEHVSAGVRLFALANSEERRSADGLETVSLSVRTVTPVVQVTYEASWSDASVYASGGVGVAVGERVLESPTMGRAHAMRFGVSAHARAGVALAAGPGAVLIESAYLYATANDVAVRGGAAGLYLLLGYGVGVGE